MGGTKNPKGVHAEVIKGKSTQNSFYKFTLKVFCEWVCVCVCEVWVLCVEVVGLCLGECVCVGVVGACVWMWLSVW